VTLSHDRVDAPSIIDGPTKAELFRFYLIGVLRQRRLPDLKTTPTRIWLRKCGQATEKIVAKFAEVQELRGLA
jgi:hypothetical protein